MKRRSFFAAGTGATLLFVATTFLSTDSFDAICAPATPLFAAESAPEFRDATPQLQRLRDGIPNFLAKVERKEPLAVAYFGGSITAADGWRVQTLAAFQQAFPDSKFTEINAAIGGTGSDLGAFRLRQDVLEHKPDLVFVEFAVNDGGAAPANIWRQFEGIVRQIWKFDANIDIVFVYTYREGHEKSYLSGKTPTSVSASEQIAEFYGIPSLDFNIPVVQLAEKGALTYRSEAPEEGKLHFSTDGVHPLKAGHEIYTEVVVDAFRLMRAENARSPYPAPTTRAAKLADVFIADNYENAKMISVRESQLSGTWTRLQDDSPLAWVRGRLGGSVYTSDEPGAKLSFRFKGSQVQIYDVLGPNGGQAKITVDGKTNEKPVPRFDSYCTYWRLATLGVAAGLDPNVVHEATIEIDAEQPDRGSVAFRLENPEKELAAPKYQGRNVWFGAILLLGELVD